MTPGIVGDSGKKDEEEEGGEEGCKVCYFRGRRGSGR